MRSRTLIISVILAVTALVSTISISQPVPQLINYQGRLTDDSGTPLAEGTTVDLTFAFYGVESGGTAYLSVLQENVQVNKGIYHVLIGSGTITPGIDNTLVEVFQKHDPLWMGVKAGTDEEMSPRSRITSVPYALKVEAGWLTAFYNSSDYDGDGYPKVVDGATATTDCNDGDPDINPGNLDTCGDGIDNNCQNGDCYPAGAVGTSGEALGIDIQGSYAYVAHDNRMTIFDISNPASPAFVSESIVNNATDVYVSGNIAYVTNGSAIMPSLYIFDVSTPSSPVQYSECDLWFYDSARAVYVSGDYAYVAAEESGLLIVDVSFPAMPVVAQLLDTSGIANGVFVSGSYAYVADGDSGLQIIYLSIPTNPSLVGTFDTTGTSRDVYFSGSYAYVADGDSGLQIIDVSTPSAPTLEGTCDTPGYAEGVYVVGNYAFVADSLSGLQIIDVTDPAAPFRAAAYDTPGTSHDVYFSSNYAYVADGNSGLQVIFTMTPP